MKRAVIYFIVLVIVAGVSVVASQAAAREARARCMTAIFEKYDAEPRDGQTELEQWERLVDVTTEMLEKCAH